MEMADRKGETENHQVSVRPENFTCVDPFDCHVSHNFIPIFITIFTTHLLHMHGTAHIWSENLHSCKIKSIKPK